MANSFIFLAYLIIKRPYKSKFTFLNGIIIELHYIVFYVLTFMLVLDSDNSNRSDIGKGLFITLISILLIEITIVVFTYLFGLFSFI